MQIITKVTHFSRNRQGKSKKKTARSQTFVLFERFVFNLLFQSLYHLARIPCRYRVGRDILHHHAPSPYHRTFADCHPFQDDAPRPYQHMVFDNYGRTLGSMSIHRLLRREHLARIPHTPVEVVGIRIHQDTVAPYVHIIADGDALLCPETRRRHSHVMPNLYHRLRPFCHDASPLMPAQRIDALARSKGEVIPYLDIGLRMNVKVDMIEHHRPLSQVSPSDG